MVAVKMGITTGPDKIAHFQIALLRHHVDQQRIAGNVKRQAEEHVTGALIELAGELAVSDIELEERVARCQRHFIQLADVPGGNDDSARVRIVFQLVHHGGDLVNMAAIRRWPGAPLLAVNRAQVAIFICPFVPD